MSPVHEFISSHESLKAVGDIAAASIAFATFLSWLPNIAAVLAIIWTASRIYDRIKYGPAMSHE